MSGEVQASVEFELTPEEWADACASHNLSSPLTHQAVRNARALFLLLCNVLGLLGALQGEFTLAVLCVLGGVVGQAALPRMIERSQRAQLRRYSEMGVVNGLFGRHRIELSDRGMLNATEHYEWLTRWSAVERVEEIGGTFMIYTGPNAFLPIPVSAFPDAASLRSFSATFYHLLKGREAPEALPGMAPEAAAR